MKKEVGLWIDHRHAVIVMIGVQQGAIKRIASNVEQHAEQSASEDDLSQYYDEVINTYLHDAEAILIFGPGLAKFELQKQFESQPRNGQIVGVESTDKMTDGQVIRKVRHHFQKAESIQTEPLYDSQHLKPPASNWLQENSNGHGISYLTPKQFRQPAFIRRSKRNEP